MSATPAMTFLDSIQTWKKQHNGKICKIAAGKLRKLYPDLCTAGKSAAATVRAANKYWQDKLAEIEANPDQEIVDRLTALRQWHETQGQHDKAATIGNDLKSIQVLRSSPLVKNDFTDFAISNIVMAGVAADEVEMLRSSTVQTSEEWSCGANAKLWLDHKLVSVKSGDRTAGHWENLRHEIDEFLDWFGRSKSIKSISGATIVNYHDRLKGLVTDGTYGSAHAKRLQGTVKSWLTWLYEIEKLDALPRNLKSKSLEFIIDQVEVEGWTKSEVKFALSVAEPPLKLWILLMVNCGFTQVDLAELTHSEVDWKKGTITRQRSKTRGKSENVPTVTYPLWKSTFALLKKYRSSDPKLVLLNEDGSPIKVEQIRNGKLAKTDNVASAYYRLKLKHPSVGWKTLKQLRKTGASLFRSNPSYTSIYELFLGHADKSIADKHYASAPMALLADAIGWLGKQLGIE